MLWFLFNSELVSLENIKMKLRLNLVKKTLNLFPPYPKQIGLIDFFSSAF